MEIIQGSERGDALPGLQSYSDIAETVRKVGFEIVKERDLAKPSSESLIVGLWDEEFEFCQRRVSKWLSSSFALFVFPSKRCKLQV